MLSEQVHLQEREPVQVRVPEQAQEPVPVQERVPEHCDSFCWIRRLQPAAAEAEDFW